MGVFLCEFLKAGGEIVDRKIRYKKQNDIYR